MNALLLLKQVGMVMTFANFDTGPEGYEKSGNFATGINTSATVGKYTTTVAGATKCRM
jgi:hypothetical protein